MPALKIRKGDRVRILQGKDRGKEGQVSRVLPSEGKVIVDGLNVVKKHQRATKATMQGGIQDKAMPIHVSNLMLICSKDGPVKAGYKIDADGNKTRVCRKCGGLL